MSRRSERGSVLGDFALTLLLVDIVVAIVSRPDLVERVVLMLRPISRAVRSMIAMVY